MATVTITYCGWEASGRNVTEAKKNAAREIESAIKASYEPAILECRGWALLLWRTPEGWRKRTIQADGGEVHNTPACSIMGTNRDEAITEARGHLAQLAWNHDDGENPPPGIILTRHQLDDLHCWARFQLAYRDARADGLNDQDAYAKAAKDPRRTELWTNTAMA